MSSEIVRRFRGVSAEPYEGYQQAVLRVYGHLPEFQLYRDLSDAASHIEALEAENSEMRMTLVSTSEFVTDLLRHGDDMAADALLYRVDVALSRAKE